jgi:hypothetical protein
MFMDEVSTRGFLKAGGAGLLPLGGATGGGANEDDMKVSRLIRMDEIGPEKFNLFTNSQRRIAIGILFSF